MRQTLEYNGHEYSWAGTFPKVVPAGSTPASTGGIGACAWVDRTDVTIRNQLSASSGSGFVGHGDGTVKSALDYIMMGYPLDATDYLPDGYVTDGSVSYTTELQQAFNDAAGFRAVLLPNFQVLIDPEGTTYGGLQVPSDSKVIWRPNSSLKIKANNLPNYEVIGIRDKQNIELFNPVIYGDKYTHTGTTGEFGMGISICGACEDIKVYYPRVYECWGDGYYIGQTSNNVLSTPKGIHLVNPVARRCRRQGMSVTSVDGLFISDAEFWDTKSSDSPAALANGPHAGIDIEPNSENSLLRNIKITSLTGGGNGSGLFYIFLGSISTAPGDRYHVDVDVGSISDYSSDAAAFFVGLNKDSRYSGAINIGTITSNNSSEAPIQSRDWPVQCRLPVNIGVANLANWKSPSESPAYLRAAVSVRYRGSDASYPTIGNLSIDKLNLTNTINPANIADSAVFFSNASGNGVDLVSIKLGQVYAGKSLRAEGDAKVALDFGSQFNKSFSFLRTTSWTFLPNILADIDVTPSEASPTCTMPDTYPTLSEGNRYRLKYTQGGSAAYLRIRSNTVPMFFNGVQGLNFLMGIRAGIVTLTIQNGAYYLTSDGPIVKES
jgi:hypothetical protein